MKSVTNFTVIGFLSVALVFSADVTGKDRDLIDAIVDYVDTKTLLLKAQSN